VTTTYDRALAELYRAPHDDFVTERKRLAKELTQAGDKSGAALLAKLARPSISAWATNQLFARERAAFDELLTSAERLRIGDLDAGAEHRRLTAKLVTRAAEILKEAGHGSSEATLRRVSANLAALSATGGFDPDPPGALKHDRDPPGFDALAFGAAAGAGDGAAAEAAHERNDADGNERRDDAATGSAGTARDANAGKHGAATTPNAAKAPSRDDAQREREEAARARAEAARAKAEAEAERRRLAEEQARIRAERRRLESALRAVKADVERLTSDRERLQGELAKTATELERAAASERDIAERLGKLPEDET
jgi:hypothetical protein